MAFFIDSITESIQRKRIGVKLGERIQSNVTHSSRTNASIQPSGCCLSVIAHLGFPRTQNEASFQLMTTIAQLIRHHD